MNKRLLSIQAMLLIAAILLGAGLTAPAMTIQPAFGKFDTWVKLLQPDAIRPTTYSLLGGIQRLYLLGDIGIATLLFSFSVCFPALKLALLSLATARIAGEESGGWALKFAHQGGKFSMLDVLILAMLVLAVKGLPGGSTIDLRVGVWLFAGSVMLSLAASIVLKGFDHRNL